MALVLYKSPIDGRLYQYREGHQPEGFTKVEPEGRPARPRRTAEADGKAKAAPANKAKPAAKNKARKPRANK